MSDDGTSDLRLCEKLLESNRQPHPHIGSHVGAIDCCNLLYLDVRNLPKIGHCRDKSRARCCRHVPPAGRVMFSGKSRLRWITPP